MRRILAIDNDTDTLDVIEILFFDTEFEVVKSDRMISIAEIAEIKPNIIIIDCSLDGDSGGGLCADIKTNNLTKHIPLILFSASHDLEDIARRICANAFIHKPFDIYHLLRRVESLAI